MEIIGRVFRNHVFLQSNYSDNWVFINNIAIGESSLYSYYTLKNEMDNMTEFLSYLENDKNVSNIVYDWSSNMSYIKKGFNLMNKKDTQFRFGWTSFILKHKLGDFYNIYYKEDKKQCNTEETSTNNIETQIETPIETQIETPIETSIETPIETSIETSIETQIETQIETPIETPSLTTTEILEPSEIPQTSFVTYNNEMNKFQIDGNVFVPVGFNAYWLGYTEMYDYPTELQIDEIFDLAVLMKATVIRSHTLGFSSGSANSLRPFDNNLNSNAWGSIDYAFYKARETGIKLICPLTDAYAYYHGNYGDYSKTRGVSKDEFWTDQNVREDFKQYIYEWLTHVNRYTNEEIRESKELFVIELGNELGNYRPDATSTSIPPEEWIRDISSFIKMLDDKHFVLSGTDESLGSEISNDFSIDSLDMFSAHFYWDDYTRIDFGANNAYEKGKPYIIGEVSPWLDETFITNILGRDKVNGMIFWNVYPHKNGVGSEKVEHNDGYTLYYPENKQELLKWSNYFRRAQDLEEINDI